MVKLKQILESVKSQIPPKKTYEVKQATGGTSDTLDVVRRKAYVAEKIAQARKEGRMAAKKKPATFLERGAGSFGSSFGASSALGFDEMPTGKKTKEKPYKWF